MAPLTRSVAVIPLWILVSLCWLVPLNVSAGSRTVTVGQPLVIRLEHNSPTSIVYPESIMKVTVGWSKKDIEADHVGPYLYLISYQPELAGRVYVVGESGQQYPGSFKTSATPGDDVVVVTVPTPAVAAAKAVPFSPPSLLRALRFPGAKPLPGEQPATLAKPLIEDRRIEVVAVTSVQVGHLYGMTLTVRNVTTVPLVLDVRSGMQTPAVEDVVRVHDFIWPPPFDARLVTADSEEIPAGVETRIYVVLERKEVHVVR